VANHDFVLEKMKAMGIPLYAGKLSRPGVFWRAEKVEAIAGLTPYSAEIANGKEDQTQ
jgi:hypothetical protein